MFWLLKKLFWLAVLVAVVYYGAQYQIDGKPIKQYAKEFYESPLVQAALKSGKEMLGEFWNDIDTEDEESDAVPTASPQGQDGPEDALTREDKKALDQVLQQQQ